MGSERLAVMVEFPRKADGRRVFSVAFERETVARITSGEKTLAELSRELGISPSAFPAPSERRCREGAAVVWVEHGPAAGDLASQLLVLEGGQMRFLGSPSDWEATREAPS